MVIKWSLGCLISVARFQDETTFWENRKPISSLHGTRPTIRRKREKGPGPMVRPERFELPTLSISGKYSTTELRACYILGPGFLGPIGPGPGGCFGNSKTVTDGISRFAFRTF